MVTTPRSKNVSSPLNNKLLLWSIAIMAGIVIVLYAYYGLL